MLPQFLKVMQRGITETPSMESHFDEDHVQDWESWTDWELRGPRPPPYEQPPDYAVERSRSRRKRKRRGADRRRVDGASADPDGPPEYDENETSRYDGDDDEDGSGGEITFSNMFSPSSSSRERGMYRAYREADYRPCPGQRGDVIAIDRGRYEHIVVNVGDDFIVHKCNGEGLVLCQCFWVVAGKDEAYVKNEFDDRWEPLPQDEIVQRAYSQVQQKRGYNAVLSNCEHFANWCRYDKWRSGQVNDAVSTITRSASSSGKKMAAAGAENGLAFGTVLGMAAGGLVGSVLGKVRELVTDEPDQPSDLTVIRTRTDRSGRTTRDVQHVHQKSLAQNGQMVGGLVGGALGILGGVLGGGLAGLVSGIGDGTAEVARRHGVNLSQMSAQLSSPPTELSHSDDEELTMDTVATGSN